MKNTWWHKFHFFQVQTKKYKQKYCKARESDLLFNGWLKPVNYKPDKASCTFCNKELAAVVTALQKHKDTAYHKEKVLLSILHRKVLLLYIYGT